MKKSIFQAALLILGNAGKDYICSLIYSDKIKHFKLFLSVCEEVPVLWSKITDWFFTWMVLEQTLQRHRLFLSAKQTWLFQCGSNWYRPLLRTQYKLYTAIGPFHGSSGSLWWTVVVLIFKPGETLTESTMYLLLELPNTIGKSNKSVGGSGNGEGGGWGKDKLKDALSHHPHSKHLYYIDTLASAWGLLSDRSVNYNCMCSSTNLKKT